jgi:hypothetical protein
MSTWLFKFETAHRKLLDGFQRRRRTGNEAAANGNLTGCAHKIFWPRKSAKGAKYFSADYVMVV